MNQKELAEAVAKNENLSIPKIKSIIALTIHALKEDLAKGNSTTIIGFGTFKPVTRSARRGRNPRTGTEIEIAESESVSFKIGSTFKNELNS